jgi:predicted PhzF superfamily epimerase YddE/YHI9
VTIDVIRGVVPLRQWTVDAFATAPFRGNPACVTEPLAAWRDDAWMQALAAENNQAETAYLLTTDDPARFGLRWFTPALEVPLCGHATLASAHVLFAELGLDAEAVTFDTKSGPLVVRRRRAGYEMDFPANPPKQTPVPAGLAEALGATPSEVWAGSYLVAVFEDEAAIRAPPRWPIRERPMTWSAAFSGRVQASQRIRRPGRPTASCRPCGRRSSSAMC